jgi:hypothetical protein
MFTRAHKLAFAAGAFAGGLFSVVSLGNAGDATLNADRIGAIDGIALNDAQLNELRGTGVLGSDLAGTIQNPVVITHHINITIAHQFTFTSTRRLTIGTPNP